jgi:hypothetical protein
MRFFDNVSNFHRAGLLEKAEYISAILNRIMEYVAAYPAQGNVFLGVAGLILSLKFAAEAVKTHHPGLTVRNKIMMHNIFNSSFIFIKNQHDIVLQHVNHMQRNN